ncbi:hypothetical protein C8R45DRAFT_1108374 [Mycena sanguinolenta]|nr:hypothetical protein C8R45DRAFT_1108374 [Mycena sanguinolenta]
MTDDDFWNSLPPYLRPDPTKEDSDDDFELGDMTKPEFFDFMPSHMRPKAVLQPPEARRMADKIRQELFMSWSRLKAIVLAHEDTIQKRWKKAITFFLPCSSRSAHTSPVQRTAVKRKQVLLDIDPKLPQEHAPEISSVIKDEASARRERRNDFLLPYVNLEDLSINNGVQFLGLLHARAHRFPSEFAWFDSNTRDKAPRRVRPQLIHPIAALCSCYGYDQPPVSQHAQAGTAAETHVSMIIAPTPAIIEVIHDGWGSAKIFFVHKPARPPRRPDSPRISESGQSPHWSLAQYLTRYKTYVDGYRFHSRHHRHPRRVVERQNLFYLQAAAARRRDSH